MLTFSRSKFVGVEHPRENTLLAHGVLEDNIYAMEIDVEVKLPELEITSIAGRMKRFTTPWCEGAIPVLQKAIGMRLDEEDFARKVNRIVGKEGCTHFANLLVECCDAIRQEVIYGEWLSLKEKGVSPKKENFLKERLDSLPGLKDSCMTFSGKI